MWPVFPRSIEFDKSRETSFKGPQGILTLTVEIIKAFLGPKWSLKTRIFEEKGNLASEKNVVAYFSRSIEHDKCQGRICKGREVLSTSIVQVIILILWVLRGCLKHNFLKKATFPVRKRFWPIFSSSIERDKSQGRICNGPQ